MYAENADQICTSVCTFSSFVSLFFTAYTLMVLSVYWDSETVWCREDVTTTLAIMINIKIETCCNINT